MIVALDAGYTSTSDSEVGQCGVVAFDNWNSSESAIELAVTVGNISAYVSGRLFERELPVLIAGLDELAQSHPNATVDCVVVDGNVRRADQLSRVPQVN